jgi:hypothetical protein
LSAEPVRLRPADASKAVTPRLFARVREPKRTGKETHMFKGLGLSLALIIGGMVAAPALLMAIV